MNFKFKEKIMSIGSRIQITRKNKKLTQTQLAEMLGYTKSNVSDYERDKASPPLKSIERIAEIMDVSIEWLITGKESDTQKQMSFNRQERELFKECFVVLSTYLKLRNLDLDPIVVFDSVESMYKHFQIMGITTIDNIPEKELIDIIEICMK